MNFTEKLLTQSKFLLTSVHKKSNLKFNSREQFYDILKEEKFEDGQYVIQQGESGNKFYIVLEGDLVAEKKETHD